MSLFKFVILNMSFDGIFSVRGVLRGFWLGGRKSLVLIFNLFKGCCELNEGFAKIIVVFMSGRTF